MTLFDTSLSPSECRLKAENLVNAALYVRDNYLTESKKVLKGLQKKIELSLTRLGDISIKENIDCALTGLCGAAKHISSSEPYFSEAAYDFQLGLFSDKNQDCKIAVNEKGQTTNIFPIVDSKDKKIKAWVCNGYCKTIDIDILQELQSFYKEILDLSFINAYEFLERMDTCWSETKDFNKRGHPHVCYTQPLFCTSKFLKLNILSTHYPYLRTVKRLLYELKHSLTIIKKIDYALNDANAESLIEIVQKAKKFGVPVRNNKNLNEVSLNESELKENFQNGIKEYTILVSDPPTVPCISCERLFCARNVVPFDNNVQSNIAFELLDGKCNLLNKLKETRDTSTHVESSICKPCITNLKKNIMPSNCVLNNLYVKEIPDELKNLNMMEKILIQRAKAFQTITKMDTVMNKNLPHYVKVDKVTGRTFHLPLPLEETLKKICPDTDPINVDHELYILVRTHPTKAKKIWENYIDIKKVWNALHWLKKNNSLYEKIELPSRPEQLLDKLQRQLEFEVNDEVDKKSISKKDAVHKPELRPLLTQISQSDKFYDNYTIYPLYNKKINETDTALYQMLQVHADALDNRSKDLDLKCFPDLYPYGKWGQHDDRNPKLGDFHYIKSKLASKHSQFRLNNQFLFYCLHNNTMRQINSGIFQMLNVINPHYKFTVKDFLLKLNERKLDGNLDSIFSRLPGTESYWRKVRNELDCMVREYGPATFFVTLSPGEWMWSELGEYIKNVNGWNDNRSISQLIADDPVSTARYFDNKFKGMLAYILSSSNPIGKVNHYYWVREYQGRGLPHYHCLFWIEDAPIYGKSPNEEVSEFILRHITCHIPNKRISPDLNRRVLAYQQHKHNSYCMRKKKTKNGFKSACRFGFPRTVTETLILRDVSVAISNRNKLKNKCKFYDLPREKDEQLINDYMPALLLIWEGNNDAQYIGESSYLLTKYVCKYGTKGEKSNVDFDIIQSNKPLFNRLWAFAVRALNHRECGAIEAADVLLGHPLHATDPDTLIKWINVNIIRGKKLKPFNEVKDLPEDSTDIFYESFVDNHYPNRPKDLEKLCLYDFAKYFDIQKNKPVYKAEYYVMTNGLYCKKRKKPFLINHYRFNPDSQPEAYYHALLLLFKHWRDYDELKGSETTYTESFRKQQHVLADAMKYHDKCKTIQEAMDNMNKLVQDQLQENEVDTQKNFDNIPDGCVPIEVENAMNDFKAVTKKAIVSEQDLQNSIAKFNTDQVRIFNKVTSHIKSNPEKLKMFVSGSGGTGKSFLIETLVSWNKIARGKDTAVTAPTGIAAYNIQGLTIHRLLQLPVEHGGTAEYKELSGAALKQIRQTLENVDLLIVDEISMVSNINFMIIHLRLTEIFDTSDQQDGWFGRINIIVFGDLLQLPPVREDFVFKEMNKKLTDKCIKSMITYNLWELFEYDELTINMRQRNDKEYSEILSRIRIGFMTKSDIETLQKRKLHLINDDYQKNVEEICNYLYTLPVDTVCLLPTRKMCDVLNKSMMLTIKTEEINLVAKDSYKSSKNLQKKVLKILNDDEDNFCGVDRVITIKIGSKIMIRRNIDVSIGLVNGTIGLVVSVSKDKSDEVISIRIRFKSGKEYDISRLEYKFIIMDKISIIRQQFPICNSYGITIHKSQGLSLENVIVEAGNNVFSNGQTYVAFSRVTTLKGLHLINFDPSCCTADVSAILEYNRLREKYRPDLNTFSIPPDNKKNQILKVHDTKWHVNRNLLSVNSEHELNSIANVTWDLCGLPNNDQISCYANACAQSLLHSPTVRRIALQHSHHDIVKSVFQQYISKIKVNIQSLREFAGESFKKNKQQDVAEFLLCLCNKSIILQNALKHQIIEIIRCQGCDERREEETSNYILNLYLPKTKSCTLQEIIDYNIGNWKEIDSYCDNDCKMKKIKKTDIVNSNTLIILQLSLFECNDINIVKITNLKINGIPSCKIDIKGKRYKVVSGIFHRGNDVLKGHYTNMLRQNNQWYEIDDKRVEKKPWPKSAKDVYLLFLERI